MIKRFPAHIQNLPSNERRALQKLIAAAEIIGGLYDKQKNPKYSGANFYPHDAAREEIENAAKRDPSILDPYTLVERNAAGRLVAVPYGKKFRKELTAIGKLLKAA